MVKVDVWGEGAKHIWCREKHACEIYSVDMAVQVNSKMYMGEIKDFFQPFLYPINQGVCMYPSLLSGLSGLKNQSVAALLTVFVFLYAAEIPPSPLHVWICSHRVIPSVVLCY
jgi:hypothetical protein